MVAYVCNVRLNRDFASFMPLLIMASKTSDHVHSNVDQTLKFRPLLSKRRAFPKGDPVKVYIYIWYL